MFNGNQLSAFFFFFSPENLAYLLKEEIIKKTVKEYFNKDPHIWNIEVATNWLNILLSSQSNYQQI